MSSAVEWVEVSRFGKPIGAVGFSGGKGIAVIAYYDDKDANKDGKGELGEWAVFKLSPIGMEGMNVVEVLMSARYDLIEKDPSLNQWAMQKYLGFAQNMIADGVYTVYFARGVKVLAGGAAKTITKNAIKEFAIRKGFESAAKKAFKAATHTR